MDPGIVERHLCELTAHPDRHVGGVGNRAATEYFAREVSRHGFAVTRRVFECVEWECGGALLAVGDESFDVSVGPYSPACAVAALLDAAATVEEIESSDVRGSVLLLHGPVAAGQLMPKNFRFYNPETHQRIIRALERAAPAAIIAATGTDAEMVGAQYPFPLFEDGDFDIPNSYMKDVDGERLLGLIGSTVSLRIDSQRTPATAEHVVATQPGDRAGRIVLSAHIDSRRGSPGALDNATGVATLLGVAERLADRGHGPAVELVPFNGEDDYANPGEILWLEDNEGRFDDIILGINVDDSGQAGTRNSVSFYDCAPEMEAAVLGLIGDRRVAKGPQWVQGDHMLFRLQGRPAIALASSDMARFMAEYAHTASDTLELADPSLVAETIDFLAEVVCALGATG